MNERSIRVYNIKRMSNRSTKDEEKMMQKKWIVITVLFVTLNSIFASDMYVPVLPAITHYFASDGTQVKLTISLYLIGLSVSQLFYGTLSDKIGRRPSLILGLLVSTIGSFSCYLATSSHGLILGRLLQGMGMGAAMSLSRTIIGDLYQGKSLAVVGSYIGVLFAIGPAVAPIIGAFLAHYFGWQSIFMFISLYALLAFVGTLYALPETKPLPIDTTLGFKKIVQSYKIILKNRQFLAYSCLSACSISGLLCYYTLSPFIIQQQLHYSALTFSSFSLGLTLVMICGRGLNIYLLRYWDVGQVIVLGSALMFASPLMMLVFAYWGDIDLLGILVPTSFYILGGGFVISNAMAKALTIFPDIRGIAGALYGSIQMLIAFAMTFIAALLNQSGALALAIILLGNGLLALLSYFFASQDPNPAASVCA